MKKVIVLSVVFLFLFVGIVPSISASAENQVKKDLLFDGNFTVFGFLKLGHQSGDEITWTCSWFGLVFGRDTDNVLVLLPIYKGQTLVTRGFDNGIISIIVYGHCTYFVIH
jgi:hypothetical protein